MIDRSLIRRYVAAIHGLAVEAGETERVHVELARLQSAVGADRRLVRILLHPEISVDDKRALLLRVAGDEPSQIVAGLVDVLLDKERVEVLLGVADVFTELADEAAGNARAYIEVAWEPDEDQKQRLREALSGLVGKPVVAEFRLEPEVIGGVRARIEGRLIDGSMAGHLTRLVEQVGAVRAQGVSE